MAISSTYGVLQDQIADEIGNRTDLLSVLSGYSNMTLSPIKNAIQSAIALWEREPFYFNQLVDTDGFSTVANQEFYTSSDYAALGTNPYIKSIHYKQNSTSRYDLEVRDWGYLEKISVNTTSYGQPTDWAYFAAKLRFYPIPDAIYSVTINGVQRLSALSAAGDANAWTQDGYDLIRCQAKLILAEEVLHDAELAAEMKTAIYGDPGLPHRRGYLDVLKGETWQRSARGRIRPTSF